MAFNVANCNTDTHTCFRARRGFFLNFLVLMITALLMVAVLIDRCNPKQERWIDDNRNNNTNVGDNLVGHNAAGPGHCLDRTTVVESTRQVVMHAVCWWRVLVDRRCEAKASKKVSGNLLGLYQRRLTFSSEFLFSKYFYVVAMS
jgi:hypothetical protein